MWHLLYLVIDKYYREAPFYFYGWEGAESADICAHISTLTAASWMTEDGLRACEARIARRVNGIVLVFIYGSAFAMFVHCIRWLPNVVMAVLPLCSCAAVQLVQLCRLLCCSIRSSTKASPQPTEAPLGLPTTSTTAGHLRATSEPPASPSTPIRSSSPHLTEGSELTRLTPMKPAAESAPKKPLTAAEKAKATRELNERYRKLAQELVQFLQGALTLMQGTPVGDTLRDVIKGLDALPQSTGGRDDSDGKDLNNEQSQSTTKTD